MHTSEPRQIEAPVCGVTALERQFRGAHGRVTERLYRCPNGFSLAARRGGALHLSDGDNWEVFVLAAEGYMVGDPGGFVPTDQMLRLVGTLAEWYGEAA